MLKAVDNHDTIHHEGAGDSLNLPEDRIVVDDEGCQWIPAADAARFVGASVSGLYNEAYKRQWETMKLTPPGSKRLCSGYRVDDVIDYQKDGMERRMQTSFSVTMMYELTRWADSLMKWPSAEEIEEKTCPGYGVKDIVSILDTRICRGRVPLRRTPFKGKHSRPEPRRIDGKIPCLAK